jgi:cytochrome P450 family 3 subfamily A
LYDYIAIYGNNILNTNDTEWKKHRTVAGMTTISTTNTVDPSFAEHHNAYLVEQSNNATKLLINRIEKHFPSRKVIDPLEQVQDVTLDVIGKVSFGYDLGVFEKRLIDATKHSMTFLDALKHTMNWGFLVQLLPTWIQPIFKETRIAVKEVERYMRELVDIRMNNLDSEKHDLLSLLVSSNQERGGLTDSELMSDVFIFLMAGHETSATTLQWMTYELAINPTVQERAYEEIISVIGTDGDITYDDYEKLQFVQSCVNETLRMHPPVVGVPKVARKDTTIGPYKVPQGTELVLDIGSIHMSEKLWPEANKYKPERFLNKEKRHPCALIPFSIGQRKCIGSRFSEIETLVIISKLLQKYKFVIPHDDPKMNTEQVLRGNIGMIQKVTLKPEYLRIELKQRL